MPKAANKPKPTSMDRLRPNPRNPRKIERDKLALLKASMERFGDLSGIILNRRTGQLVGGHQRTSIMRKDSAYTITPDRVLDVPDATGTVLEGRVSNGTLSFAYREVDWPEDAEAAANIAANKGAGVWDIPGLKDMINELDHLNFDLNYTMFDTKDLDDLFGGKDVEPELDEQNEQEQAYKVIITCQDQDEQEDVLSKCNAHGWNCKPNNPSRCP